MPQVVLVADGLWSMAGRAWIVELGVSEAGVWPPHSGQDRWLGSCPDRPGQLGWTERRGSLAGRAAVGVDPDEAVMPRIAFGVVACPVAAVLRDTPLEPVPSALGEPQ